MQLPEGNPRLPDNINNRHNSPVLDFLLLAGALLLGIVMLSFLIGWSASWLAPRIPFAWEPSLEFPVAEHSASQQTDRTEDYLNQLMASLLSSVENPFPVHVKRLPDDEPNAFATLGGHIYVTDSLLQTVDSENGLAMVLAHEYMHIHSRHPAILMLEQLGHSLLVYMSGLGDPATQGLIQGSGTATMMAFSRDMESDADEGALRMLKAYYGHTDGAGEYFRAMLSQENAFTALAGLGGLLASHPDTRLRLERIEASASTEGHLTPLPPWLTEGETDNKKPGH